MDKLLTLEEVAAWLRLSKDSVYRLTQGGKIPAFKVGTQWRFKQTEIDAWMTENKNSTYRRTSSVTSKEGHT